MNPSEFAPLKLLIRGSLVSLVLPCLDRQDGRSGFAAFGELFEA
jgi:hypothetical protein